MQTLFESAAAKKAAQDLRLFFLGLKPDATIPVTRETAPVLEELLEMAHERAQQKGGL